ncbi:hypothetical protein C8Q78DRAFT_1071556 [Trametes maxima]|nr:hypothetical protein C8Q78DRAFT_1071556 [Trametes maxima]
MAPNDAHVTKKRKRQDGGSIITARAFLGAAHDSPSQRDPHSRMATTLTSRRNLHTATTIPPILRATDFLPHTSRTQPDTTPPVMLYGLKPPTDTVTHLGDQEGNEVTLSPAEREVTGLVGDAPKDMEKSGSKQGKKPPAKVNNTIVNCHGFPRLCGRCALRAHEHNPFHRLWRWDVEKGFWDKMSTAVLGVRLYGGRHGKPCPQTTRDPREIVVGHEQGLTKIQFVFCECPIKPGAKEQLYEDAYQLLERGLFPASWKEPRLAFTLSLMKSFNLLSLQTHCSAQDFYQYLRRMTDNIAPDTVDDRYRELGQAAREFAYLRQCRRAGETPGEPLQPGSLAVLCPCCPQPGLNMRPQWERRDPKYNYVDAMYYSIDGNFRQRLRQKPLDKNDVALSQRAAYFADVDDFHTYQKAMGKPEAEVSSCHKFGAMGYNGHSGQVSGIIALACRHMFLLPGSIVDLNKGEAYLYVDFAVTSALQRYRTLRLLKQSYDIGCQYLINFRARLRKWAMICPPLRSVTTTLLPRIEGSVGSWHVNAHKADCRVKQSPEFVPGCAKNEGEGMERVWGVSNEVSLSAREMTPGHRHDALNDHFSDLNVRQVHGMARMLKAKLQETEVQLAVSAGSLAKLENSVAPALLDKWRAEEAEWLRKVVDINMHKELDNPYSLSTGAGLSEEAIATLLRETRAADSDSLGIGLVGAIKGMLEIERDKLDLIRDVRAADPSKVRSRNALTKRVTALRTKAAICEDYFNRYVGAQLAEAAATARRTETSIGVLPENFPWRDVADDEAHGIGLLDHLHSVRIDLPSMYHSSVRQQPALQPAVEVERKLREGQANDALHELRTHLTAVYSLADLRQQGVGQDHSKRVKGMSATEIEVGRRARDEYRRVRVVLRVLGMKEDHETYRVLTDKDAKPFVVTPEQHRRGDSKRNPSWLWEDFSFIDDQENDEVKEVLLAKTRPHWFRRRAAKARWEEELHVKREEMFRTLRFFEMYMKIWNDKAQQSEKDRRYGAGVYAKRLATYVTIVQELICA